MGKKNKNKKTPGSAASGEVEVTDIHLVLCVSCCTLCYHVVKPLIFSHSVCFISVRMKSVPLSKNAPIGDLSDVDIYISLLFSNP